MNGRGSDMAKKTKKRVPSAAVKAAADAAEARSKGEPLEGARDPIDPPIKRTRTKTDKATKAEAVAEAGEDHGPRVIRVPSVGRPTAYKPEFCELVYELSQAGATDIDIADACDVHVATVYRWRARYPLFREAMQLGKEGADERVERSMYHRAVGYSYSAVKIMQNNGIPVLVEYREHVPPDVVAAKHWLGNRDPKRWREQLDVKVDASEAFVNCWKALTDNATSPMGFLEATALARATEE